MEPTKYSDRLNLTEEDLFEEDGLSTDEAKSMSDEDLKIESLKIATNIAKLMSNVTTDDIVEIAGTVAKFIKGDASTPVEAEEPAEENTEENEDTDETEEDFTV